MIDYLTITEIAEKWELSTRRIRFLCEVGKIAGATKFGRNWAIPVSTTKPEDSRIKSGKYIKTKKFEGAGTK